jgi:hypothetical protein
MGTPPACYGCLVTWADIGYLNTLLPAIVLTRLDRRMLGCSRPLSHLTTVSAAQLVPRFVLRAEQQAMFALPTILWSLLILVKCDMTCSVGMSPGVHPEQIH